MVKLSIFILLLISMSDVCYSQNINQNVNQNVNQNTIVINNQPVIEKKEYIIKYRPVYIEKPQPRRYARRLPAPVCLLNYLWVYPEDLGSYDGGPDGIIAQINRQGLHGRNTWRIPTSDELQLMENYADKCGLGDGIYLSTSHRNGILRLVSTGMSVKEQQQKAAAAARERARLAQQQEAAAAARERARLAQHQAAIDQQNSIANLGRGCWVNGLLWSSSNMGTSDPHAKGIAYTNVNCPANWRLPSENEFRSLIRQSTKHSTYYQHSSGLIIPFGVYAITSNNGTNGYIMLPNMMVSSGSAPKFVRVVQDKIY